MSEILFEKGSIPATPPTDHVTLYPKDNGGSDVLAFKDSAGNETILGAGSGDVVGPASAVNNDIAVFDGVTGKLVKDGGSTIAQVKDRANHTGTQLASTISDFDTAADVRVAAGIATHAAAADPHPGYALDADVTAAQAYAVARANHTGTQLLGTISDVTIAAASLNALDDGVNTALHFHDSDRARANHTGTQTASTISDFTAAAKSAAVANAIVDSVTDVAPSQNAVFDALATKMDLSGGTFTGPIKMDGDLAGTGNINLAAQSSSPATPASGVRVYANQDDHLSWKGQSGQPASFDTDGLSAARVYGLPDNSGTLMMDPMTTNGDIIYRSSGVATRLPIGAEDEILRVVSGAPAWVEENLTQDFGDGSDGNLTIRGALTLTQPLYANILTIDVGAVLNPAGYPIYCKVLDLTNAPAGSITRRGNNGVNGANTTAGQSGGTALPAGLLGGSGGGTAGAAGAPNAGTASGAPSAQTPSNGGSGGNSGASGAGGSGAGAAAGAGGAASSPTKFGRFEQQFLRGASIVLGGGGGDGGNSGGGDGANTSRGGPGGGSGGGVLAIYAGEIITGVSTPAGVIDAGGGTGGTQSNPPPAGNVGGASGAGGGGGGYVFIAYIKKTGSPVAGLITAKGGNGGNGAPALGTGVGGNGGNGGNGGRIQLLNVTTGVGTETIGATGGTGTAGVGLVGGTGGNGGACEVTL